MISSNAKNVVTPFHLKPQSTVLTLIDYGDNLIIAVHYY